MTNLHLTIIYIGAVLFITFGMLPFLRKYNYDSILRRNPEWVKTNPSLIEELPSAKHGLVINFLSIIVILIDRIFIDYLFISSLALISSPIGMIYQTEVIDKVFEKALIKLIPKKTKLVSLQKRTLSNYISPNFYKPLYFLLPTIIIVTILLDRIFIDKAYIFLYGWNSLLLLIVIYPRQRLSLNQMQFVRNVMAKIVLISHYIVLVLHIIAIAYSFIDPLYPTQRFGIVFIVSVPFILTYYVFKLKKEQEENGAQL